MNTAYRFDLWENGLLTRKALASMAGISVSRTLYRLFHDYFWVLAPEQNILLRLSSKSTGSPRKDFNLQLTIDY